MLLFFSLFYRGNAGQQGTKCLDSSTAAKFTLLPLLCNDTEYLLRGKDVGEFGAGVGLLGRCFHRSKKVTSFPPIWSPEMDKKRYSK